MFDLRTAGLLGCVELTAVKRQDQRGFFVKTVHRSFFAQHGLDCDFAEQYYSSSNAGCLRGMHFQLPPHDHAKLVFCIAGAVQDVVLDLRVGSPTYGQAAQVELSADRCNMLYIPRGFAHGFCVVSAPAVMVYNVTSEYAPSHDAGILWRSVPVDWRHPDPVVSERDARFPALTDYQSPFVYNGAVLS